MRPTLFWSCLFITFDQTCPMYSCTRIPVYVETLCVLYLLVVQSISGCDTTSCSFCHSYHGKTTVFKKMCNMKGIQYLVDVLESLTIALEEVTFEGCGFGGSVKDRLNHLSYSTNMQYARHLKFLGLPSQTVFLSQHMWTRFWQSALDQCIH